MRSRIRPAPDPPSAVNTVTLVGRVSAPAEVRTMPSGDDLVTFRVIVARPRAAGGGGEGRTRVDVIDVACWTARTRRVALRLEADRTVRVEGALRRRFFRAGGGATSRYEVEARSVARVRP